MKVGVPREIKNHEYRVVITERIKEGVARLAGVIKTELELLETFGPDAMPHTPMPTFGANTPAPDMQ